MKIQYVIAVALIAMAGAGHESASAQQASSGRVHCTVPNAANTYGDMGGFITVSCPKVAYTFHVNRRYEEFPLFSSLRGRDFNCVYDQRLAKPDVVGSSPHSALSQCA
jgi:hypothetical protein